MKTILIIFLFIVIGCEKYKYAIVCIDHFEYIILSRGYNNTVMAPRFDKKTKMPIPCIEED